MVASLVVVDTCLCEDGMNFSCERKPVPFSMNYFVCDCFVSPF